MWWGYTLIVIFIFSCVILIVSVLLQPGKSDAAALFGGGASQTAFGPRGTQNFLGYLTIVTAILFLGVGLLFSFSGVLGPRSVVHSASDTSPVAPPAQSPVAPPIEPIQTTAGTPAGGTESGTTAVPATDQKASKKSDGKSKAKAPAPANAGGAKP